MHSKAAAKESNCTYHSFNSEAKFEPIIDTKAASESAAIVTSKQLGPGGPVSHPGDCCGPSCLYF